MERVFGMDVHRDLPVTTVKTEEGEETRYSWVSMEDVNNLMEWLREKKCYKGVMGSSGIYWVPIYTVLADNRFDMAIADARQVKAIPGKEDGRAGLTMACESIQRRLHQAVIHTGEEDQGAQIPNQAQG